MRLPAILEDGNAQQWVPNPEDLVEIEDNDIHDTTEEAEEEVPSKNSTNAEASNSQVPEDGHASLPTNTLPPISESSLEHTSTPVIPPESEAVAPAEPVEAVQQDTTQSPVSQPSQAKRRSLKRKLSICEEDTTSSGKENDVFRFTRVSDGERPQKTAHVDVTSDTRASKQGRRALEPKNSNTKLPSPVKVAKEGKEPAKIPEKKEKAQKGKRKGRRSTKTVTPSFVENQTHVAEIKLDERQPTTDTSSAIAPTENAELASPTTMPYPTATEFDLLRSIGYICSSV
ncbi:hypothetical protein KEM55_008254 [Ascosphaera atra]|nr:hypothetical protein KEM55_008254 [Ascosphaera atra]